jgi:hypothetical protein
MDYDYCKLYIQADISHSDLKNAVAQVLDSDIEGRTVETSALSLDVCINKESDPDRQERIVHWPFYLEVEAVVPDDGIGFVAAVQSLIDGLKLLGMRVRASCNFEDKLSL